MTVRSPSSPRVASMLVLLLLLASIAAKPAAEPVLLATLQEPDHVDVTVLDAQQHPVEGATVAVCTVAAPPTPEERQAASEAAMGSSDSLVAMDRAVREAMSDSIDAAMHPATDWAHPTATYLTDAQGFCRVPWPGPRSKLLASRDGLGTSGLWSCVHREMGDTPADWGQFRELTETSATLTLRIPVSVTGVVLDSRKLPVADAIVKVTSVYGFSRKDGTESRWPPAVASDSAGRFRLDFDPPCSGVLIASAGSAVSLEANYQVEPGSPADVVLNFPGAYSISGHIVTTKGSPIPMADVTTRHGGKSIETISDAQGHFQLDVVDPGDYSVGAKSRGYPAWVRTVAAQVTISEAEPRATLDITLVPSCEIGGTVRWSTGEPVRDAMVTTSIDDDAVPEPRRSSIPGVSSIDMTSSDGHFRARGLSPGWPLEIEVYAGPDAQAHVRGIAAGTMNVEAVLDRELANGCTIVLDVADADTGARVLSYQLEYGDWMHGVAEYSEKKTTVSDPRGRFLWEHARLHRKLGFRIRADGYSPLQVGPITVDEEDTAVLARLGRPARLELAVVDADGQPVPYAAVLWAAQHSIGDECCERPQVQAADEAGVLALSAVAPGRYAVQARDGQGASDIDTVEVPSSGTGRGRLMIVDDIVPGELDVGVADADGDPIAGADVSIQSLSDFDERGTKWHEVHVPTDLHGYVPLQALGPGLYNVWPKVEGNFIAPVQTRVHSGQRTTLRITPDG